ncbi:1-deoxy-D-xylulose-5-phosphate synthase, partial [bacterium]
MRTDPRYFKQKEEMEHLFKKIPAIGSTVLKAVERIKDSFKYLVVTGMLFEELGFTYLGPINGHNITEMQTVLKQAKRTQGPVLVHLLTQKGRGYRPAEENPDRFHGTGPFDIASGEALAKSPVKSYTEIFSRTLCKLAKSNQNILAVTAAMPTGTGLDKFARQFPKRFFDVGIAEQHAVTMSAGLAVAGYKPVLAVYSTFLQRAYDQVLHDVALQNLPVVFAIDRAGLVGEDGETHQGIFDFAYLRHIPNMVVMAPKDENELQHMLYTAVNYHGPTALRYPRGSGLGIPLDKEPIEIPIGRAEILREGKDVTIIAVGPLVYDALTAADQLNGYGIEAAVINGRFIKPLDEKIFIEHIRQSGKVLTLEENVLAGGFGSAVLEMLEQHNISARVKRLGIGDEFVTHGPVKQLKEKYGLTVENIVHTVMKSLVKTKFAPVRINMAKP